MGRQDGNCTGTLNRKGEMMIIRWLLFKTQVGALLLALLEQRVGLAMVTADWLGAQRSGEPVAVNEMQ